MTSGCYSNRYCSRFLQEYLDPLYRYAKFQYGYGNYSGAAEYLYLFPVLTVCWFCLRPPFTDRNALSSLWGKLASEILRQNWEAAMEDLTRLRETIDNNSVSSPLQSLQQRTWLIHWSLFVFFNHPKGRDNIIELFLYQPHSKGLRLYLNAIQTMCPHILRYLTIAVITNKDVCKCRQVLKDLVKVIQQESYTYKDPITFVECLYVNFDFDSIQKKLRECESVLVNDFFLVACLEDFIENARLFIFEAFCRIHQCISISMLADTLNMTPEEVERWIVNLIRNARLDAKIDCKLMLAMNIEEKLAHSNRNETMEELKPKRKPLIRAASEESSSDLSSLSCNPSLGDTLPWNLPKHHRIKRSKSASGDVLDAAERAVIRIAGQRLPEEQDYVQAYENVREKYKGNNDPSCFHSAFSDRLTCVSGSRDILAQRWS
ncbi:LOW QUALITY PROTEIN: eukaryotic translation initiation factor 3 subunit E-B [Diretmus argenteus]